MLTADDVLLLPVPDDAIGYELVDGRAVTVMPSSPIHGRLSVEISRRLKNHLLETGLPGLVLMLAALLAWGRQTARLLATRADALETEIGLEYRRFAEGLRKMNRHDKDHLYP